MLPGHQTFLVETGGLAAQGSLLGGVLRSVGGFCTADWKSLLPAAACRHGRHDSN